MADTAYRLPPVQVDFWRRTRSSRTCALTGTSCISTLTLDGLKTIKCQSGNWHMPGW
ncbi:hypothetical protein PISMIDRAFT_673317 [Pisolithus microcarpus 441]|uniref:Uncharacterized protein n=1 Tax=Pisolithus microcarpus 441 TaxID=765257 RepID=A0A0D0AAN7_9AGAM|nr:hypothetical protein PISMIDRAFT_673317 [Pisolithus microcarpus 441]